MISLVALSSLLLPLAAAIPCVQFDTAWNLYAFGGSQDVNLGQSSSWGSPNPTTLTSTGRPPWTGNNTQCLLSQYNNAMYVLGGDASDLSKVYIYNFAAGSWSTQSTTSAPSDYGNSRSATILDHDTNVFFTLTTSSGLYQLDFSSIQASASSEPLKWEAVTSPSFSTSGYTPVAAQASNHINYFGVPGTAAGSADLFIVHFALFQQQPQSYPTANGGTTFPDSAGQAISIPSSNESGSPPYQMVYVPNDFSQSFVITHWTDPGDYTRTSTAPMSLSLVNSTQLLPAPSSQDTLAAYAASDNSIVQIDTKGDIYYLSNAVSNFAVSSSASWQKLGYSLSGTSGGSTSASGSASGSASATGSATSASRSGGASKSAGTSASGSAQSGSASAAASSGAALVTVGEIKWSMFLPLGLVAMGAAIVL